MKVRPLDEGPSRLLPAADHEGILAWADEQAADALIRVTAWGDERLSQRLCAPGSIKRWLDETLPDEAPDAVAVTLEVCGQLL